MDYQSNLVLKKHRHRGIYSGVPYQLAGRIFLPEGTVLGTSDNLLFIPVGEKMSIKRITIDVRGDLGSAVRGSIGYFQILDSAGNPVVVQRRGPNGASDTIFTSPTSDTDAYKATGVLSGYSETIIATPLELTGPVNIGIDLTAGDTVVEDTWIYLGAEFDGETSPQDADYSLYGDNSYWLD